MEPQEQTTMQQTPDKASRRNFVALLGTHLSYSALIFFTGTFFVAQLFSATGSIGAVAWFHLLVYIIIAGLFIPISFIIKKHTRVLFPRIATVLLVGFICMLIFWQDGIANYYMLFGVIYGIILGFYWCAMHCLTVEIMGGNKMKSYQAIMLIGSNIITIALPIILGAMIDFVSFRSAAILALVVGVCLMVFTFVLLEYKPIGGNFAMRKFFKTMKHEKKSETVWLNFWVSFNMSSLWMTSICTTILIIYVYGGNFELGMLLSLFAVGAIVLLTLYRLIKSKKIKNTIFAVSSLTTPALAIPLLFNVNQTTLIIFLFGNLILAMVTRVEASNVSYNTMKRLNSQEWLIESNFMVEFAYLFQRIIFLTIMIIGATLNIFLVFKILVVIFSASAIAIWTLTLLWRKSLSNIEKRELS